MRSSLLLAPIVAIMLYGQASAQDAQQPEANAMPGMTMPLPMPATTSAAPEPPIASMDMIHMPAVLGPYPMTREASGTSWQPDASPHQGVDIMAGQWALMFHGMLDLVHDAQGGPRGGDKTFVAGMVMGMGMASRDIGERGRVQFRAMLSPDPLMGANGYPLLLATGETADGHTPLIDRQHPHDLFAELSASYSYRLTAKASIFLYGGLPGEPAFGPPAFMHRLSIMDSPEAPISHHWVDSMHITEGVLTGGITYGAMKLEMSGYKGREPNQHRYDIEKPKLDSLAVRASLNPTARLALQVSWARQISPEQLEPDVSEHRWSASAIYTVPIGKDGFWSTSAIWAQRRAFGGTGQDSPTLRAWVLESAIHPDARWTFFGRAEMVDNNELLSAPASHAGQPYTVGRLELGAIRDFPVTRYVKLGLGVQAAKNFVPRDLSVSYDGNRWGGMGFARLKLG